MLAHVYEVHRNIKQINTETKIMSLLRYSIYFLVNSFSAQHPANLELQ